MCFIVPYKRNSARAKVTSIGFGAMDRPERDDALVGSDEDAGCIARRAHGEKTGVQNAPVSQEAAGDHVILVRGQWRRARRPGTGSASGSGTQQERDALADAEIVEHVPLAPSGRTSQPASPEARAE